MTVFQPLDSKAECVGIYTDGSLVFDRSLFPDNLTHTWAPSPYFRDASVDYASYYLEGKNLTEHIPEFLQEDWELVTARLQAFHRSLHLGCVNLEENCFFDLVPDRFLIEYCEVKNEITSHVLNNYSKPRRYAFYKEVGLMLQDISSYKVRLDIPWLQSLQGVGANQRQVQNLLSAPVNVRYNQFGTKTGRLSTKKNSFPILTLKKELRRSIRPHNDLFVELDFNGAEARVLMALLGISQPQEDVHTYHLETVFSALTTRDEAKVAFFSWLYGASSLQNSPAGIALSRYYSRADLLERYYQNGTVTTPYHKEIDAPTEHHALNYLIQSTTAELTLKQALKINYYLRNRCPSSKLAFIIHDSVILDMREEDLDHMQNIMSLMSSTNFGDFLLNCDTGKYLNLGEGAVRK